MKPSPLSNQLLAALPVLAAASKFPQLELVELTIGQVLYEAGGRARYAYFPLDCIISLLNVMTDGALTEVAAVGNEGMFGITVLTGDDTALGRAVVQCPGHAYRVSVSHLQREFSSNTLVRSLFLRYTQCLITQLSQTAACLRHHSLEEQLCRWLLTALDRLPSGEISITQELIANALGVRREGVNEAIARLLQSGVITHSRGHVRVVDRPKLEALCCECYAVVRNAFSRLMRMNAAVLPRQDPSSVNDP